MTSKNAQYSFGDPEWDVISSHILAQVPPDAPFDLALIRKQISVDIIPILKAALPFQETGITVENHEVDVDGGKIIVRSYIPDGESPADTFPLYAWFHGGGFMAGDLAADDVDLRILAYNEKISIISVDYRLAPEYKFPTQLEDVLCAVKWALDNAALLRIDVAKGLIVGGASAGGNLAAQVALQGRDDPVLSGKITGQVLQIPWLAVPARKYKDDLRSIDDLKDSPFLTAHILDKSAELAKLDPHSSKFSPILAESLKGLPKAIILIAGRDPLRDEAILYERFLKEAGVEVRAKVYTGCPHAFAWGNPGTAAAKEFRKDTVEGIRWMLGK
ncbi:hypothetical protein SISNIDRAFT_459688 [Sistotremastrum niveocremeum HHB9708]|uniref:Alpha/beta hydrolase fold-3 domain-containing protein n=1 Tax=Sistotremastrum niveocremeum HHB9708 TaxID=1314777 RepID=A0A164P873_9AGAM|nr:hypothetical protein SISNIDRAFT_459688 [Sistotremastrum niveocremeum HHB9708]